jgi:hypothetical protein
MNHHYASIVHQDKMATFRAEADGSRLAARGPRHTLRQTIHRVVAIARPKHLGNFERAAHVPTSSR